MHPGIRRVRFSVLTSSSYYPLSSSQRKPSWRSFHTLARWFVTRRVLHLEEPSGDWRGSGAQRPHPACPYFADMDVYDSDADIRVSCDPSHWLSRTYQFKQNVLCFVRAESTSLSDVCRTLRRISCGLSTPKRSVWHSSISKAAVRRKHRLLGDQTRVAEFGRLSWSGDRWMDGWMDGHAGSQS